jgi:hypothetical protein
VLICLLYIFEVVEFGVKTASGWDLGRIWAGKLVGGAECSQNLPTRRILTSHMLQPQQGSVNSFPVIQLLFHADM